MPFFPASTAAESKATQRSAPKSSKQEDTTKDIEMSDFSKPPRQNTNPTGQWSSQDHYSVYLVQTNQDQIRAWIDNTSQLDSQDHESLYLSQTNQGQIRAWINNTEQACDDEPIKGPASGDRPPIPASPVPKRRDSLAGPESQYSDRARRSQGTGRRRSTWSLSPAQVSPIKPLRSRGRRSSRLWHNSKISDRSD